ncbi:MAG TPA: prepilin peptidase [Rhizobiaceae bacterium]|nr:prepilin peptidase [Rhizobiaceae bacterium]
MYAAAVYIIFPLAMIYAIVSDAVTMKIANRVSVGLAVAFVPLALIGGMPLADIGMHLVAGLVLLAATFCLFSFGVMGGGDAKLIAATAIWYGWNIVLVHYILTASMIGGGFTLALLMFRHSPLAGYAATFPMLRHLSDQQKGIPYGIALGIAGLLLFPDSPLFKLATAG